MIPRCYQDGFQVDAVTADLDENAVELQQDAADLDIECVESLVEGSPVINLVNYSSSTRSARGPATSTSNRPGTIPSCVFVWTATPRSPPPPPRHPSGHRLPNQSDGQNGHRRASGFAADGRLHVAVEGREIDLRVSTLPTVLGGKVVMRVLDRRRLTFNLDVLGIPSDMLGRVKQLLAKPHGLLLVTGPTGSGKTTTLYSALELVKSVHRNIVTVEDPVEYQIEQVNQVQADEGTSFTFAAAPRSILRQDPDVIMVGEIRDTETAQVAVQAALTGHLVLSTLHTNDSAGAVTRLVSTWASPRTRLPHRWSAFSRSGWSAPSARTAGRIIILPRTPRRSITRATSAAASPAAPAAPSATIPATRVGWGFMKCSASSPEFRHMIVENANLDEIRAWHKSQGGRSLLEEGIRLGRTRQDESG